MAKRNILIIAAHPDDEVLGAGGAIARHVEEGDSVSVLIFGEGIASRKGERAIGKQQQQLYADARKAHKILGVKATSLKSFPDNAFDSAPLLSLVHEIEAAIRKTSPHIIYTHHGSDTNVDHRIVREASDAAVRPMNGRRLEEVRAFEVPSSTEWNFTREPFCPNVFVALSENQLKKKIHSLRAYRSEIRTFPHPRSPQYLEALARVRGGQSGNRAAEAFELVYRRV
jgi:LmbE family N-acetylglucosaminyl deacetylase